MLGLNVVFYMFIIVFAVIGLMRGFAKEILVTFSALVSLFILTLITAYVPVVQKVLVNMNDGLPWLLLRIGLVTLIVLAGYQTANIPRFSTNDKFTQVKRIFPILGMFLGAINGFLIFGSIWFFIDQAKYPFPFFYSPPDNHPVAAAIKLMIPLLAPSWLVVPTIYFVIAIAFVLILVVFV